MRSDEISECHGLGQFAEDKRQQLLSRLLLPFLSQRDGTQGDEFIALPREGIFYVAISAQPLLGSKWQ